MIILKVLKPLGNLLTYIKYKKDRLRISNLIDNGLKIGKNVYIQTDVDIDDNYPYLIEIEDNCRISIGVRILAHDATVFKDLGVTRIAPVRILEGTFIGERAIILPGVTLGPRAIIAAGSVVNRDIGEGLLAVGNPARPYGHYNDMLNKFRELATSTIVFNKNDIEGGLVKKENIIETAKQNSLAFIHGVPYKDPYYLNADIEEIRNNAKRSFSELSRLKHSNISKKKE